MLRIRRYEEAIANLINKGEVKCPCHLYVGQEAVAVGICTALRKTDYVFSNYRGHGHYLAKGGDANEMMAEIMGKVTGCSKGRGGSMHLVAPKVGILGNTAIVAGNIAPAVGAALKSKLLGKDDVSVVFFGDGATEEGVFFEALNFAVLKKLPVIFVCENNSYAAHMKLKDRQPFTEMASKTQPFLESMSIDGNDVTDVSEAAVYAINKARDDQGPTFIECKTYRVLGHVGPNDDVDKDIRTQEEVDDWKMRCPIKTLERKLLNKQIITRKEITRINNEIKDKVRESIAFANKSHYPREKELMMHVY